jgi:hypothetical protein
MMTRGRAREVAGPGSDTVRRFLHTRSSLALSGLLFSWNAVLWCLALVGAIVGLRSPLRRFWLFVISLILYVLMASAGLRRVRGSELPLSPWWRCRRPRRTPHRDQTSRGVAFLPAVLAVGSTRDQAPKDAMWRSPGRQTRKKWSRPFRTTGKAKAHSLRPRLLSLPLLPDQGCGAAPDGACAVRPLVGGTTLDDRLVRHELVPDVLDRVLLESTPRHGVVTHKVTEIRIDVRVPRGGNRRSSPAQTGLGGTQHDVGLWPTGF